jgi:hypothetical protein
LSPWKPARSEPQPLEAAIYAVIRHVLAPDAVKLEGTRQPEGWFSLTLPTGQAANIAVEIRPDPNRRRGPRTVVSYEIVGHATLDRDGFSFSGQAAIDEATRAFLELECSLTPLGRVG